MRRVWLFLVLAAFCFGMASCSLPSPEQMAELNELKSDSERLGEEVIKTAKLVDETKKEILEVYEKGKKGELSAAEVTQLLTSLYETYNEGQQRLITLNEQLALTQSKIKELSESGVPWWQIAIWLLLGGFNVATGAGFIKERGNGKFADYAVHGISSIVKYIEEVYNKKGTVKDVKKKISNLNHFVIEDAVSKLPPSPVVVYEPPPKEEPPAEEPPGD